jgi:hypothetical protein
MTFPRFQLRTDEDVPPEVLERRAAFANYLASKPVSGQSLGWGNNPETTAEAFGRDMFARCGKDWPRMIGLASAAAMKAERDAMGDVK